MLLIVTFIAPEVLHTSRRRSGKLSRARCLIDRLQEGYNAPKFRFFASGATVNGPRELIFYTKPDCPLCVKGMALVKIIAKRNGLEVREVHIDRDADLFYRHRYRIPVVEYDGNELGWGRLDEDALESQLEGLL